MIDGILDISLPDDKSETKPEAHDDPDRRASTDEISVSTPILGRTQSRHSDAQGSEYSYRSRPSKENERHLFTVKPGGIAGYMGQYTSHI